VREIGGGLEGWVRLLAEAFLDVLDEREEREEVVREVCEVLQTIVAHGEGDGAGVGK